MIRRFSEHVRLDEIAIRQQADRGEFGFENSVSAIPRWLLYYFCDLQQPIRRKYSQIKEVSWGIESGGTR